MKADIRNSMQMITELLNVVKSEERLKGENYMTTDEVTEKYKISRASLYRRKNDGYINCLQTGRVVRWPESEVKKNFKLK